MTDRPPGTVWCPRTSRWVLRRDLAGSLRQVLRGEGPTTREIMDQMRETREETVGRSVDLRSKPDFKNMSGQELLDAWNAMAATPRKSRFHSIHEGIIACEDAWKNSQHAAAVAARQISEHPEDRQEAPRSALVKKPVKEKQPSRLQMRISRVTRQNPRRPGTAAHAHFEEMTDGRTVGEYLEQFAPEDRRTAAQWLGNTVRDGHVKVVP